MGLLHRYVKVMIALMQLAIDVCVETAIVVAKPLVIAVLDAYNAPLGFTMETFQIALTEGPGEWAASAQQRNLCTCTYLTTNHACVVVRRGHGSHADPSDALPIYCHECYANGEYDCDDEYGCCVRRPLLEEGVFRAAETFKIWLATAEASAADSLGTGNNKRVVNAIHCTGLMIPHMTSGRGR